MIKNKKIIYIFCILIFVIVSYLVLRSDSQLGVVRVRTNNLVINQKNPHITNKDVDINIASSSINGKNKEVVLSDKDVYVNSQKIKNHDIEYNNSENIKQQISDFDNYDINYSGTGSQGTEARLKNIANAIRQNKYQQAETQKRHRYENVSWNSWKSNIVNKFLEDSVYIKSLDEYNMGSWFYYSFIVTKYGEIKDIKVKSMYLSENDKIKVKNLIESYAHKDITRFPSGSKRKEVKVDAVVLLGDSESKAKPSDFHDFEKIRAEY